MSDTIPDSDVEFLRWAQKFTSFLSANATVLEVLPIQVTAIQEMVNDFESALTAFTYRTGANVKSTKEYKNFSRSTTEETIRLLIHQIRSNSNIPEKIKHEIIS
jgi:ribosomal protein L3